MLLHSLYAIRLVKLDIYSQTIYIQTWRCNSYNQHFNNNNISSFNPSGTNVYLQMLKRISDLISDHDENNINVLVSLSEVKCPIGKSYGGCAPFMTNLFTPISSSGDPQFQVNLQLRCPKGALH